MGLDYERLSRYLKVLAEPNRLVLLHKLQLPHVVADIELRASRSSTTRTADRIVSRRNVEAHLARLDELGLVHVRETKRDGRSVSEFLVNHGRLFVVVEELRRLSLIQGPPSSDDDMTQAPGSRSGPITSPEVPAGPSLVVVGGPVEGRSFALDGDGPWTVGRAPDRDVSISYDPFVSGSNCVLRRDLGRFKVIAGEGARNGTRVNWSPIPAGEARPLVSGDIIGVGRSYLVFREV